MAQTGHLFKHLVALSSYRTTDGVLKDCMNMPNNLPKALFLQSSRNNVQVNQKVFFDADPTLASMWFRTYLLGISTATDVEQRNMYHHLANMDERWVPFMHPVTGIYFTSTYHNPQAARRCKSIMNKALKERMTYKFENNPDPNSIAIVTCRWHRNHAVYKSASPLVEQLIGKRKLTLIWTGEKLPPLAVTDYFDKVAHCYFKPTGGLVIPPELEKNDFGMIYYPDIGMSDESVWLANARIAPIQAMGYGHPETSGDNSEIDYFIGGDVEKESTDQYSETMVLLPGLAQEPAWPTAERKNNYKDDGVVRVNCVWGPDKYNHTLLTMLAAINETVNSIKKEKGLELPEHEFHLFASPGINRYGALPVFAQDITNLIPNARIHSEQEYYDYMENAEMHDFSLNSFPFGCYNVLIESLYMGLPFLSLVGDRFYNRAGMWLNNKIGMGENNFDSPREFINKAAELITNPAELRMQREYLAWLPLKETLFTLEGNHFLEAVDYIQANHPFTETKIIGESE